MRASEPRAATPVPVAHKACGRFRGAKGGEERKAVRGVCMPRRSTDVARRRARRCRADAG
eukprot:4808858-Pleurochrysis_carterae.AAC.2